MFAYRRPPVESNRLTFLNEVPSTLDKTANKYDNILVIGDFSNIIFL